MIKTVFMIFAFSTHLLGMDIGEDLEIKRWTKLECEDSRALVTMFEKMWMSPKITAEHQVTLAGRLIKLLPDHPWVNAVFEEQADHPLDLERVDIYIEMLYSQNPIFSSSGTRFLLEIANSSHGRAHEAAYHVALTGDWTAVNILTSLSTRDDFPYRQASAAYLVEVGKARSRPEFVSMGEGILYNISSYIDHADCFDASLNLLFSKNRHYVDWGLGSVEAIALDPEHPKYLDALEMVIIWGEDSDPLRERAIHIIIDLMPTCAPSTILSLANNLFFNGNDRLNILILEALQDVANGLRGEISFLEKLKAANFLYVHGDEVQSRMGRSVLLGISREEDLTAAIESISYLLMADKDEDGKAFFRTHLSSIMERSDVPSLVRLQAAYALIQDGKIQKSLPDILEGMRIWGML